MHQLPTVLIPDTIRKAQLELPTLPEFGELQRPIKAQKPQPPQLAAPEPQMLDKRLVASQVALVFTVTLALWVLGATLNSRQ